MNQIIRNHNKPQNSSSEIYILKQKVSVNGVLSGPIESYETVGICTKLSDAVKIKETNQDVFILTVDKALF